jgi:hypothetical protein
MLKKIIVFTLIIIFSLTFAHAKYVRFAVNMKGAGMANANDAYMTSTFQNEIGLGSDLTHGFLHLLQSSADTNIYYATYNLPAFQMFEYQFEMGIAGYDIENIPLESQSPTNGYRWLYVDSTSNDTLQLPAVFYNGNNSNADTMYRFRVNMSNETISLNGVHIAGDFQGSNPATSRMYSFGNGIYDYMAWLTPGAMVHYKFYNGNATSSTETVPPACAMGGKRMIGTVLSAQKLPIVCFSSCTNCIPASTINYEHFNTISVSPNPMFHATTISFNDNAKSHLVSIVNMCGSVVKKFDAVQTNNLQISKENLAVGCYFLQILNDQNERTILKLIIE